MRLWANLTHPALLIGFIVLSIVLARTDILRRWDNLIYDTLLANQSVSPTSEIIIIEIDDASIAEFGQWPWPREVHADLLNQLANVNLKALGFDLLFTEPDRYQLKNDVLLADAIKRHGKVVLPVHAEEIRFEGQLKEQLPIPQFTENSAAIGHIHIEPGGDGVVRTVFLRGGVGNPEWPHFSLALAQLDTGFTERKKWANNGSSPTLTQDRVWLQSHPVRIPFVGPPGTIHRVSYADVVFQRISLDIFEGKFVLVGMTASGVSDRFPTPVSGDGQLMAGVEILANLLAGIIKDNTIQTIAEPGRTILVVLPVLLLLFIFPRLMPLASAIATLITVIVCLLGSFLLLKLANLWLSPAASVLTLLVSYPVLSWIRLESTVTYLKEQIDNIHQHHESEFLDRRSDVATTIQFFEQIFSLKAWVILDKDNNILDSMNNILPIGKPENFKKSVQVVDDRLWYQTRDENTVGLQWPDKHLPDQQAIDLVGGLQKPYRSESLFRQPGSSEIVQRQISQLKKLSHQLDEVRSVTNNAISNMADGVIITGKYGNILVANAKAQSLLGYASADGIINANVFSILSAVKPENIASWQSILPTVYVEKREISLTANRGKDLDLYLQLTPIVGEDFNLEAVVINISDISELKETERKRAEILSFLSHDLRSPLVSILALLEVEINRSNSGTAGNFLQRVDGYAKSALKLSEQFVELIRAEIIQPHQVYDVDLAEIATNAIDQLWDRAQQKHIQIVQHNSNLEFWIRGDPELIERAFTNLLDNAIKYSGEKTTIELEIQQSETHFICVVSDQGCGIPGDSLAQLFDLYHRASRSGESTVRGSGLGLAFVKAVADRHGGHVTVASEPGKGARFSISFPRMQSYD